MVKIIFRSVFLLLFCGGMCNEAVAKDSEDTCATVNRLFCKGIEMPIGVTGTPIFGWHIDSDRKNYLRSAYEIELADDSAFRDHVIWRSGKIDSDNSVSVKYAGPVLNPAKRYYWRVRVWDTKGEATDWSRVSSFVTGLGDSSQWQGAEWIAMEHDRDKVVPLLHAPDVRSVLGDRKIGDYRLPLMRKSFNVKGLVKSAIAFVCGLGQFEYFVNGAKVGDHFLDPGWTLYDKEAEYVGFDITDMLTPGENTMGIMLGNGMYNIPRERYFKFAGSYGAPKMKALLSIYYDDGSRETVVTDLSWVAREGPVTFSSIFGGEDYDARKLPENWCGTSATGDSMNISNTGWNKVVITEGPAMLKPQLGTALKVKERFAPQRVLTDSNGKIVYDFGQNISGIVGLKIKGKRGQTVRLHPAELIDDENCVNQSASGGPYYFTYTIKGDSVEYWQPQFSYYGFRYVQLDTINCDGLIPEVELTLLHTTSDNRETGYFQCSDALFNDIYNLIDRAMASNSASVLTDCPHREKLGWLEQAHLMQNSLMSRRDMHHIYRKAMADMAASQLESGCIPTIAPEYVRFVGGFEDSPEWGSAFIQCSYKAWLQYGDEDILSEYYPRMKRFLEYFGTRADNHIVAYGLGDWYDIGPDNPGYSQLTSLGVTATAIYYQNALAMSRIAKILNEKADSEKYDELASEIRGAFNSQFYKPAEGYYDRNSQTANAMALALGLVEEENRHKVEKALADNISAKGLTAGDIGYWYVIKALEKAGLSELLYNLNKRYDTPGYGWQLAQGATCLTESWQAYGFVSNNHMMLGHLMEWLFSGLAGISPDSEEGSRYLVVAPQHVGDVLHAEARIETPYGEASSRWDRQGDNIRLSVEVSANSYATVKLPGGSQKIGSGHYRFEYVNSR